LLVAGAIIPLAIDLGIGGVVVIAVLVFERWRYTPRIDLFWLFMVSVQIERSLFAPMR